MRWIVLLFGLFDNLSSCKQNGQCFWTSLSDKSLDCWPFGKTLIVQPGLNINERVIFEHMSSMICLVIFCSTLISNRVAAQTNVSTFRLRPQQLPHSIVATFRAQSWFSIQSRGGGSSIRLPVSRYKYHLLSLHGFTIREKTFFAYPLGWIPILAHAMILCLCLIDFFMCLRFSGNCVQKKPAAGRYRLLEQKLTLLRIKLFIFLDFFVCLRCELIIMRVVEQHSISHCLPTSNNFCAKLQHSVSSSKLGELKLGVEFAVRMRRTYKIITTRL